MKKILFILVGLIVLFFVGRAVLLPKPAPMVFERMATTNVGVDPASELEDGSHVFACGAGSPLFDAKPSGPCIAVLAGEKVFIFDAGSGGSQNLMPMSFPVVRTDAIYLTHLHSDHIDGLGQMQLGDMD